jgi:hypothetical protein
VGIRPAVQFITLTRGSWRERSVSYKSRRRKIAGVQTSYEFCLPVYCCSYIIFNKLSFISYTIVSSIMSLVVCIVCFYDGSTVKSNVNNKINHIIFVSFIAMRPSKAALQYKGVKVSQQPTKQSKRCKQRYTNNKIANVKKS